MNRIASILILILISVNLYAFEQSFTPQTDITVGDKTVLNIKADGLMEDSIDKSKISDLNFGDFELLDIKSAQDGSVDFILSSFKAGKVELLSVEIPYSYEGQQKFVKTKALPVEIKSVLDPQKPSNDICDIKGLIKFRHGFLWYLYIIISVVFIIVAIYFIYRFIKKRNRKQTKEEIILSIPPREYALKQLDDLLQLNLVEQGHIKEYYDKLSDIIRYYISRTYAIDGMEKTTSELYMMLKNKIPAEYNRELKNYLINCDFVKFAKVIPSCQDIENDFRTAKNFVEKI